MSNSERSFWLSPNGLAVIAFIGVVSYFVLTEQRIYPNASLVVIGLIAMGFMGFSGMQLWVR